MWGNLLRLSDALRHRARLRQWSPERAAGQRGEDLAHRFLRRAGYTVVARNYRTATGSGELDLVAWDGATLVFVEVKSRTSQEYGAPGRALDAGKRERLRRAGRDYARRADVAWERVRFDLVEVLFSDPPSVAHFKDAFRP